ncbi:choline/ethanolamine kinase [Mesorhizobium tianshanense]|uniref:Thiamine kinase-like enzyme n=1 Tax=Mesorhizobium tianshanense TaxID=39844 RepID=A0A562NLX4_9HYPH|nr:choline/ethanolamine kinase family protein [Mesorhizobium tianshanense]TWI33168.1 thiamine kinase-like enzyme [Mesorhizobium tianshanense]GLS34960.1 choline/ethanolamine kinase [Mesorhizobium tianshanense]
MEHTDNTRLQDTLARVPQLRDFPLDQIAIVKVGGLTNRNYKITVGADSYVLRVPGEGTEQYVDRRADEQAGRLTSNLGVNAELIHYEPGTGVQLTRYIDGATMMTPDLFKDLDSCSRAGMVFAKLHRSGATFYQEFNDVRKAQEYLDVLKQMGGRFPEGYDDLQKEALVVRGALLKGAPPLVPSHNDPVPENFINTVDRMYLLDWEFAGNNDPMWDLGDLSVEGYFDERQDRAMLTAYNGGEFSERLYSRMILQKAMVFLLWTLWGALQVANKNPLKPSDIHYPFDDFWEYTIDRFTRCREIMERPDFGTHIDRVRG